MTDGFQKVEGWTEFTHREADVVELLLLDEKSPKRISRELGIASGYVRKTIKLASAKGPGCGTPSYRLTKWFWGVAGGSTSAIGRPQQD